MTNQITALFETIAPSLPLELAETVRVRDLEGKLFLNDSPYPICTIPYDYHSPEVRAERMKQAIITHYSTMVGNFFYIDAMITLTREMPKAYRNTQYELLVSAYNVHHPSYEDLDI